MSRLFFHLRMWLDNRLPTRKQRVIAFVAVPLMAICAVWIVYFAVAGVRLGGGGPVPESPAVRHAAELTRRLHENAAFAAVTVRQHVDFPERFRVSGDVKREADLRLLEMRLAELEPKDQFVIEVGIVE